MQNDNCVNNLHYHYKKQKFVSQWIEKMVRGDMIQRCAEGNWQNPIFVVPKKKSGEYRLVNDFRKGNEQLIPEYLPSKKITDMLSQVQVFGATIFTTVDLQPAFFSIPTDPVNSELTALFADCGNNVSTRGKNLTGRYKYKKLVMSWHKTTKCLYAKYDGLARSTWNH